MIDHQTIPPNQAPNQPANDAQPKHAPLRVALAHDWLVAYRGGEMVLDAIAAHLRDQGHTITRIYTMFDAGSPLSPALDAIPRSASALNRYPPALRRWLLMRYPGAVRQLSRRLRADHEREPIDLLISSHSAAIKAIEPPPGVPHLCYCHTPARYLWSQIDQYHTRDLKGRIRTIGLRGFAPTLRRWDRRTADRVTAFMANSAHTASEIRRCYDRPSAVLHPPVRTDFYTPDPGIQRKDELLLVSALEPYKRVDLAIDAAVRLRCPLTIVGTGSHESALRRHASGSDLVRFAGRLSDHQLRAHYRTARALLFPQIEDFGITAVEAQACGCPVVARRAGGALDSVIENRTGSFFDEPNAEAIARAIQHCPGTNETAQTCRENALRFGPQRFVQQLGVHIRELLTREHRSAGR